MTNKRLKIFTIDNKGMQFNADRFNKIFCQRARSNNLKIGELTEQLASAVGYESETVRTWRKGKSGPGDEATIKAIAEFLEIDYLNLFLEINNDNKGDSAMNTTLKLETKNNCINENLTSYSYFTKSAIIKAYDMITDFIHSDDPEDIYGFISLAVKLRNMKGIIPASLHEKLMNFIMTEVKNWMLYPIPDIDDIEDDDVELANAVYETPYSVLRNLHKFAEVEMEPYIMSKKSTGTDNKKAFRSEDYRLKNEYKEILPEEITYERIEGFVNKGQILIKALVDEQKSEISELTVLGIDYNAESYYTAYATPEQLQECLVENVLYPLYNFKQEKPLSNCAPIDINSDNPNVVNKEFGLKYYYDSSKEGCHISNHHYEFYVSKGFGDFKNFGGPLELEFIEKWMTERGYYDPDLQ